MSTIADLRRFRLAGLAWAGLLVGSGWAGEPGVAPDLKMPAWVVVKPGADLSKVLRPIEPASFAVDVGVVAPETGIPIELEIRNISAAPIRIVGGNQGCSRQGCIAPRGRYPLTIAPGATGRMLVEYMVPKEKFMPVDRHLQFKANFYVGATTTFAVPFQITADVAPAPVTDAGAKTEPTP